MAEGQWAKDPYERFELRYFDGQQWTEHVTDDAGVTSLDPAPFQQAGASAKSVGKRGDHRVARKFDEAGLELWFSSEVTVAGGHVRIPQPVERANIAITDLGIALIYLDRADHVLLAEPWDRIIWLCVEDESAVTQRLTGTRVLFLGVWSLLAKKKIDTSFLTIQLADGPITVAVIGTSIYGLRSLIDSVSRRSGVKVLQPGVQASALLPPAAAQPVLPAQNLSERLRSLEQLHSDGLITSEEFTVRRQAILESI